MQPFFFVHLKNKYHKIEICAIRYVLSIAHHSKIVTDHGTYLPHLSLKQLERVLPADAFCRVNRGTLVNLGRIVTYEKDVINLPEVSFPLTKKCRSVLEAKITLLIHREGP